MDYLIMAVFGWVIFGLLVPLVEIDDYWFFVGIMSGIYLFSIGVTALIAVTVGL